MVRHCTSITMPDGMEGGSQLDISFPRNHVYGTFTAAKERIVDAGRYFAAHSSDKSNDVGDKKFDASVMPKKKTKF